MEPKDNKIPFVELKAALQKIADAKYLHEACQALLEKFSIKYTPVSHANLPVDAFLEEKFIQNENNRPLLKKIREVCVVGIATEDTFTTGLSDNVSADEFHQNINNNKYQEMAFFSIDTNAAMTRTEIATLTRALNRRMVNRPVVLFVRTHNLLSMATCERTAYIQSGHEGEKAGKVTLLCNIDCSNPHRGHLEILSGLDLSSCKSYDELYAQWLDTFSNELLTKKFYSELSDWYAWAVQVVKFPNDLRTNEDDIRFNHESCIRLITRLIFVWFLKQKKLIPEEFFDENYIRENLIAEFNPHDRKTLLYDAEDSKYYRLILQNLFFAMLNCPIVAEGKDTANNRRFRKTVTGFRLNSDYNVNNLMRYEGDFMEDGAKKFIKLANSNVPFLNGGLFDCLDDKPNNLYYDGFSERKESLKQLYVPDYLFFGDEVGNGIDLSQWYDDKKKKNVSARGIIDILKRYSFTIEENTPFDQEVSLDPELLGKAFENLLASFNPETKTSARKQTGSFYTPREIVQYMVDESLVAHLKRMCGDEMEPQYRSLVSYTSDDVELTKDQRENIMKALYNCRVLDPACGSGAFPMGVLQQMVHVLKRIDPSNEMWKQMMVDNATEDARKELEKAAKCSEQEKRKIEENRQARLDDIQNAFNQNINDPDYARKLYLIEHCIYGVDIQPIATQISKLRFFISLVVDQKPTSNAKENFGIRPLPNLEAKFVTANTLIPLDRNKDLFTSSDDIRFYEEQLHDLNHRIFLAKRNKEKQELRHQMIDTRRMMAMSLENLGAIGKNGYTQLTEWNMFDQNASASFFDPEWMFGVKDGFDVVIGNPPYIQLQSNGGLLGKQLQAVGFESFASTGDIYCLFYEKGWQLLSQGGHVCYITSNKWMRAGYGEKMRTFFANKTNPKQLIDFAGVKIFESATVDTNILLFERGENQSKTIACVTKNITKNDLGDLSLFVQRNASVSGFTNGDSWVILSPIELSIKHKIEAVGIPLKDWDIQINYGIKTGFNDAFIITTEKRDEILANCTTKEERDKTAELIQPILRGRDIKRYGYDWANLWLINTHNGVKENGKVKIPRIDVNEYPAIKQHLDSYWDKIEKRADQGDTPYNLRNCAYVEDFLKPKIIYNDIAQQLTFALCENGEFLNNTAYFFTSDKDHVLEFLLKALNTKVMDWYYRTLSVQLGEKAVRMFSIYVLKLPIPNGNLRALDSLDNDALINRCFCSMYGMTEEEIEFIENQ